MVMDMLAACRNSSTAHIWSHGVHSIRSLQGVSFHLSPSEDSNKIISG